MFAWVCPKRRLRKLCALAGGPLDGTARQWGAIRIAHGLNGLVMREEHVLKMIEFIEAPKRQLAHPVGDLLQRFAESLPGSVWNLRLNLVSGAHVGLLASLKWILAWVHLSRLCGM